MNEQKIIAITGPSSSGKTALAVSLAKELNGEIISVDSRQVYKGLDIGSAKPTIEERDGIPHYMMDVIEVTEPFTVADFCDGAKVLINDIISRGKLPILAGGTGLYFRTLLQDFDLPRVAPNEELRAELDKKDTQELFNMLLEKDYDIAQKIHFNNNKMSVFCQHQTDKKRSILFLYGSPQNSRHLLTEINGILRAAGINQGAVFI